VDNKGYLLTNRHVVSPWLEDSNIRFQIYNFMNRPEPLQLGYRVFLWFEGEKAFKRIPGLSDSTEVEDIYVLSSAFRTDGNPRLIIAGVARAPDRTWQLIRSPLKDDFAVLKIDQVPQGLRPLQLSEKMEALKVPKLSPVIALGFPLGSRTQEAAVNVSVTSGHVRRTFENLVQVDTSIHKGNSGGPVIDIHGKVIGIASGVATDWAIGPVPVQTLLPDMGMVLPINKAANFLEEIKAGKVKWNGVLDLSVETKIRNMLDLAEKRHWSEAQSLADKELETSNDPTLVLAAAMIHFFAGDHEKAGHLFEQALSMDDKNDQARLMLFLIDWMADRSSSSPHRLALLALDWRSPHEFFGYLVRVLERTIAENVALRSGYTDNERNWLRYAVAQIAAKNSDATKVEKLLQPVVLATERKNWLHFLSLVLLEKSQQPKLAARSDPEVSRQYQEQLDQFAKKIKKSRQELSEHQALLTPLQAKLGQDALPLETKREILEQILTIEPGDMNLLADLVFYCAMNEDWTKALEYARRFRDLEGRENANRLRVGLLAGEILLYMDREKEAMTALQNYKTDTKDGWYRLISDSLLNEKNEKSLMEKAGESPEYMLTGHVALAFWAEGSGDNNKAIDHYREALGSYMDDMIEYVFAVERINRLRQKSR